jgi:hypothetical protein
MASSGMLRHVALVTTDISEDLSLRRLLVTANVVHNSPILFTLMMKALSTFEASVLTRTTRCKIPEDSILENYYTFAYKFNTFFQVVMNRIFFFPSLDKCAYIWMLSNSQV